MAFSGVMSQTAGFKQDSYDLAYTRHMHDAGIYQIDNFMLWPKTGPEIRQDIHVFTASMTIYGLHG